MAGASIGQNGMNINPGDYVRIPYSALSLTPGQQGFYIGVCLTAGGNTIGGVYLNSSGAAVAFSNIQSNQCLQIGQAAGPLNASAILGQ